MFIKVGEGPSGGSESNGNTVYISPESETVTVVDPVTAVFSRIEASTLRKVVHEIGHVITDRNDDGPWGLNNSLWNENLVLTDPKLGKFRELPRGDYTGGAGPYSHKHILKIVRASCK